jgi:hypothetical protein
VQQKPAWCTFHKFKNPKFTHIMSTVAAPSPATSKKNNKKRNRPASDSAVSTKKTETSAPAKMQFFGLRLLPSNTVDHVIPECGVLRITNIAIDATSTVVATSGTSASLLATVANTPVENFTVGSVTNANAGSTAVDFYVPGPAKVTFSVQGNQVICVNGYQLTGVTSPAEHVERAAKKQKIQQEEDGVVEMHGNAAPEVAVEEKKEVEVVAPVEQKKEVEVVEAAPVEQKKEEVVAAPATPVEEKKNKKKNKKNKNKNKDAENKPVEGEKTVDVEMTSNDDESAKERQEVEVVVATPEGKKQQPGAKKDDSAKKQDVKRSEKAAEKSTEKKVDNKKVEKVPEAEGEVSDARMMAREVVKLWRKKHAVASN